MWSQRCMALLALAIPLSPVNVSAGSCDGIIIRWDDQAIDACVRELKSEITMLRLQLQIEESENRLMRNNLCLLATEIKTENSASIAEIACEELKDRAAAKKKAASGGAKSKKP
jgi:hypothetical protein